MGCAKSNFYITKNYFMHVTGLNSSGELGLGDTTNRDIFERLDIENISDIKKVVWGVYCLFVLYKDGTLYACGKNSSGKLGLGNTDNMLTFTKVDIEDVDEISSSYDHTLIIKKDKTLWGCGYGTGIGMGSAKQYNFIYLEVDNVKEIATSNRTSLIMKEDGELLGLGENSNQQLGMGKYSSATLKTWTKVPIENIKHIYGGYSNFYVLDNDNILYAAGDNYYNQVQESGNYSYNWVTQEIDNIKEVSVGRYHIAVLTEVGDVYIRGSKNALGINSGTIGRTWTKLDTTEKIIDIYANYDTTLMLTKNHEILTIGDKKYLGIGEIKDKKTINKVPNVKEVIYIGNNWNIGGGTTNLKYLIKSLDTYYTLENGQLLQITDDITNDIINDRGVDIEIINNNIDLLPNEYSLLNSTQSELELNTNQYSFVSMKNEIDVESLSKFKKIICENTSNNNDDNIRFILKVNGNYIYKNPTHEDKSLDLSAWNMLGFTLDEISNISSLNIPELDEAKKVLVIFGFKNTDLETKTLINKISIKYDKSGDILTIDDENITYNESGLKIEFTNNVNKALVRLVKTIK